MLHRLVDVTSLTNKQIIGPLTSWQVRDGPYNVEHLAGMGTNGDLLVFYWSPRQDWTAVNVSQITGQKVASPVTSWQTPDGPYNVEHLAGMSSNGDLLVFYWSPRADWQVVNVSAKTGQKVASPVTSWQTPDGPYNVEHLAGMSSNGDLLVFYWSPRQDWTAVNVSQITGQKVASPVTSWQVRDGPYNVEHLAGQSHDGSLYVFWWSPRHDWQAINVSEKTGRKVSGPVTSWVAGTAEHLAGQTSDNSLLVFWWTPQTDWQVVNVSEITGDRIAGIPSSFQIRHNEQNAEMLAARDPNNSLVMFWYTNALDWQSMNISEIAGQSIRSDPVSWTTPSGVSLIEHYAAEAVNNRLLLFWGDFEPIRLTDDLSRPFQQLKRQRYIRRNAFAVLWKIANDIHAHPVSEVDSILFGNVDSVRNYFLENSGGKFTIDRVQLLGWYDADYPADHYFGPLDPDDRNGDGWVNGHVEKWAEAIRKADRSFDFSRFDRNAFDGRLSPNELGIIFVTPGTYPRGFIRDLVGREYPRIEPLIVDGTTLGRFAELYIGDPLNLAVGAHELSHLFLDAADMYFEGLSGPVNYAAGDFSMMDNTSYTHTHLDPFHKLKYGWLRPKIVFRTGRYSLSDIKSSRRVLILMDPRKGADEYYILEVRNRSSFDRGVPDEGLAIWHIMERPEVYGNLPPPPGISSQEWQSKVAAGDWGRRAIQLVRPVKVYDPQRSLWDGSDPETGYDILSVDPNPQHVTLTWADGTPSGFSIRSISPAGQNMSMSIGVPF